MQTWQINVDGEEYTIKYKYKFFKPNYLVYINDEEYRFNSKNSFISILDCELRIKDTILNLTCTFNKKARLAINGKYLDNGENYQPIPSIPPWVTILNICYIFLGIILFGIIPTILGYILINFGLKFILINKKGKFFACFIGGIILQIIINILLALIIYN